MQHLGINFGGILRFELGFLYLSFFMLRNIAEIYLQMLWVGLGYV